MEKVDGIPLCSGSGPVSCLSPKTDGRQLGIERLENQGQSEGLTHL